MFIAYKKSFLFVILELFLYICEIFYAIKFKRSAVNVMLCPAERSEATACVERRFVNEIAYFSLRSKRQKHYIYSNKI
ncbi:MAG: hypothetical protein EAZ85_00250 [Bacteroidetes bacterium]|nr:MAG: hypothetical protein EAZ85_00250 [Bacteroidota bacterium]TAG85877.1 MAG: hypothetical protein EAZ20_13990 [Bacteroidota bacterium]